jgi:hypothetical protein
MDRAELQYNMAMKSGSEHHAAILLINQYE